MRKYILGATYESVGVELPELHLVINRVPLTPDTEEYRCYQYVLGVARNAYDMLINDLLTFSCMLALFIRLRQCCIAPWLMTPAAKVNGRRTNNRDHERAMASSDLYLEAMMSRLAESSIGVWLHTKEGTAGIYSTKMKLLATSIEDIVVNRGRKLCVFSTFTSSLYLALDMMAEVLPDVEVRILDGSVKMKDRESLMHQFLHGEVQVFLVNLKVGGMGLNLVECRDVMLLDPWWTPAYEQQAVKRCHRIGQTEEVTVHRLYIRGSVEDRIIQVCDEKIKLAQAILAGVDIDIPRYGASLIGDVLGVNDGDDYGLGGIGDGLNDPGPVDVHESAVRHGFAEPDLPPAYTVVEPPPAYDPDEIPPLPEV